MKRNIFIVLILVFFSACTSKVQNDILDSSKDDVSNLLSKLIQKEKEVNRLTQELENCRNNKK